MTVETLLFEGLLILLLIILNGFFSSAEIAIISSKRSVLDKLAKEGNRSAELVNTLKDDSDRFLATVQVGVTIVSTLASVIGGIAAIEVLKPLISSIPVPFIQSSSEGISIAIVTAIISYALLVGGELVPKSLAIRYSDRIACFAAKPISRLSILTGAFVRFLTASTSFVLKVFGIKDAPEQVFVSEEEIKFFITEGKAKGIFEETEADLLHGVFEFADTTVKEIMVPKASFNAIDIETPKEETLKIISESGLSRFPVYRESTENVIGVLFNKDVFRALAEERGIILNDLIRTPYFVPNSIMISRLLREMQRRKLHMAIVVDEHGDVDGLVTIEDILEEIVGEIEDEYDVEGGGLVEKLKDGTLIISASASLRDLDDLGLDFEEEEEYNTIAGFMLAKLQRIPRGGEFVIYKERRFTVVDVEDNRIMKVKAENLNPSRSKRIREKPIYP